MIKKHIVVVNDKMYFDYFLQYFEILASWTTENILQLQF